MTFPSFWVHYYTILVDDLWHKLCNFFSKYLVSIYFSQSTLLMSFPAVMGGFKVLDGREEEIGWLVDWLIDWLIGWLIDWLIGWLIDWLIGCLVGWLIDWLVAWLVDWLIDWLIGWLIDWLIDWLVDWLIDWLIDWLVDWLIDWLIGCLVNWLIDWLIGWLIDWLTDWLIDWLVDWLIDWLIGNWLFDWLTDWLIDWFAYRTIGFVRRHNSMNPWNILIESITKTMQHLETYCKVFRTRLLLLLYDQSCHFLNEIAKSATKLKNKLRIHKPLP